MQVPAGAGPVGRVGDLARWVERRDPPRLPLGGQDRRLGSRSRASGIGPHLGGRIVAVLRRDDARSPVEAHDVQGRGDRGRIVEVQKARRGSPGNNPGPCLQPQRDARRAACGGRSASAVRREARHQPQRHEAPAWRGVPRGPRHHGAPDACPLVRPPRKALQDHGPGDRAVVGFLQLHRHRLPWQHRQRLGFDLAHRGILPRVLARQCPDL
jgi:hypothetical protein